MSKSIKRWLICFAIALSGYAAQMGCDFGGGDMFSAAPTVGLDNFNCADGSLSC